MAFVKLRGYQSRMVEKAMSGNTIVMLPTGSGKTLIAAEAVRRVLEGRGSDAKCLFLVPKVVLVQQQAAEIRNWLGQRTSVGEFHGELSLPEAFDVLVATPDKLLSAQTRSKDRKELAFSQFDLVVFDEVHHVLKDNPYRKIALRMHPPQDPSAKAPLVLGLTASPSYKVDKPGIKKDMDRLTLELRVKVSTRAIIFRRGPAPVPGREPTHLFPPPLQHWEMAEPTELQADGYHATAADTRVISAGAVAEDDMPLLLKEHRKHLVPPEQRKPHLMARTFWDRVKREKATPFSVALVKSVHALEAIVAEADSIFESPLCKNKLADWGLYAHKRTPRGAGVLGKLYPRLENWYEALRILVASWEEDIDLVLMFLKMRGEWDAENIRCGVSEQMFKCSAKRFAAEASQVYKYNSLAFTKIEDLKRELLEQLHKRQGQDRTDKGAADREGAAITGAHGGGKPSPVRGIIFVQQRIATHIVDYFIKQDDELRTAGFRSAFLYSTKTKGAATASLRLTPSEADRALNDFRSGDANLLVATSVAEEGLDVPEANLVVRYDSVQNAVSFVQASGRARQQNSEQLVLSERSDRNVPKMQAAVSEMRQVVAEFTARTPQDREAESNERMQQERKAAEARERGARDVLLHGGTSALATINLYTKKTKAVVEALCNQGVANPLGASVETPLWDCTITYKSALAQVEGAGTAQTKKLAKRSAAEDLLQKLKKSKTQT